MKSVADVLQMGLNRASRQAQSHYLGMCCIISTMHNEGFIIAPESKATLQWIDEQLNSISDEAVYLVHWLEQEHATEDSDVLYALWHQWYTNKIKELNQ